MNEILASLLIKCINENIEWVQFQKLLGVEFERKLEQFYLKNQMLRTIPYKKISLWSLFMDGTQLSQDYRTTARRQFIFYHKTQEFLVLIWLILQGWKIELTLEPSSGFEPGNPELRIQCPNRQGNAVILSKLDYENMLLQTKSLINRIQ